jgi:hypothetical protein
LISGRYIPEDKTLQAYWEKRPCFFRTFRLFVVVLSCEYLTNWRPNFFKVFHRASTILNETVNEKI